MVLRLILSWCKLGSHRINWTMRLPFSGVSVEWRKWRWGNYNHLYEFSVSHAKLSCRLINLTMGINMPNLHMRLNNEERLDIGACLIFLESFNGIPISRNEQWLSSEKHELFIPMHLILDLQVFYRGSGSKGSGLFLGVISISQSYFHWRSGHRVSVIGNY